MFQHFSAPTANDLWTQVTNCFRHAHEGWCQQSSRNGPTREILHATLSIQFPVQRWVVSRCPPINPAFALAEVIWILTGRRDAAFVNYFNRSLSKYAGTGLTYHGAYGFRLRRHHRLDQLERAYRVLDSRPDDRQVVLQIWDSRIDLPNRNLKAQSRDIPCNIMSMLKVRGGALEWTQVLRSNDVFRGLPYNLVQFTCLQEVMAGWLGLKVGSYNQVSDSLHVYRTDARNIADARHISAVSNTDSLSLPKKESEAAFAELARIVTAFIEGKMHLQSFARHLRITQLPTAHRNILSVLVAESARRDGDHAVAEAALDICTNPCLRQLWNRWKNRFRKDHSS